MNIDIPTMKRYMFCVLSGIVLLACACKKEDKTEQTGNPVVTFISPSNHKSYDDGDTIFISGSATDDRNLVSGSLLIVTDLLKDTLFEKYYSENLNAIAFDTFYIANNPVEAGLTISASFTDNDGNSTEAKRNVHVRE